MKRVVDRNLNASGLQPNDSLFQRLADVVQGLQAEAQDVEESNEIEDIEDRDEVDDIEIGDN